MPWIVKDGRRIYILPRGDRTPAQPAAVTPKIPAAPVEKTLGQRFSGFIKGLLPEKPIIDPGNINALLSNTQKEEPELVQK
jgi:hypothetical protein